MREAFDASHRGRMTVVAGVEARLYQLVAGRWEPLTPDGPEPRDNSPNGADVALVDLGHFWGLFTAAELTLPRRSFPSKRACRDRFDRRYRMGWYIDGETNLVGRILGLAESTPEGLPPELDTGEVPEAQAPGDDEPRASAP